MEAVAVPSRTLGSRAVLIRNHKLSVEAVVFLDRTLQFRFNNNQNTKKSFLEINTFLQARFGGGAGLTKSFA